MDVSIHIPKDELHYLKQVQTELERLNPEGPPRALLVPGSPEPRGTIIVFPGSFNPPTTAHLALLKQAGHFARMQALALLQSEREAPRAQTMQLYVAISKHIVDKEQVERPLLLDRIMLLHTLLQRHLPDVGILLFNRGLYVEQAQAVYASFRHVSRLLFLMGFDKIVQILDPHYYADRDAALYELFRLAELLVAPRGDEGEESLKALLARVENRPFAHFIHGLPFDSSYRNISSTQIREQASAHIQDIPQEVRDFMRETRAYAPPLRLPDGSEIDYYAERTKLLEQLLREAKDGQ